MAVDVPEVQEVRGLLEELGERALVARINSFVRLNEGLESKRGKEFIEVTILGFLEGILVTLKSRHPSDERIAELYEKIVKRREELDALFRKPNPPIFEDMG